MRVFRHEWACLIEYAPMGRESVREAVSESAAEQTLILQRWPSGVCCPRCGSPDPRRRRSSGRSRWRCRKCRYDFGVAANTLLHASKAPFGAWVSVALGHVDGQTNPTNPSTKRRIRRIVESTGLGPGPERLAALVATPAAAQPGPLHGLAEGHRRVLATLRARLAGATAERVAVDCGLSAAHTRRCLRHLRDRGFAESSDETTMWGYAPIRVRLWRLRLSGQTLRALPQIGWIAPAEPPEPPETVPPEFWYLFWSGECASRLRLPADAVHVADTLIGGSAEPARIWALTRLPVEALRQLSTMTGYDSGPLAQRLNAAIQQRACV